MVDFKRRYDCWKDHALLREEISLRKQSFDKETPAARAKKREWGKVQYEIDNRKKAGKWDPYTKLKRQDSLESEGEVQVSTYTKSDGTKVRSHRRSRPS